ncbi:MAG TPA: hypothetical protein VFP40_14200 [Terriglobales bacterium]|nr:hypothetical protein [Terriglobales bacterium]
MNEAIPRVNKSVLLIDANARTREARAANLRKLGATVDAASNATMGLFQFGTGSYRLVLIDLGRDLEGAERLASEIRLKNPSQSVGFMVEGPTLISKTLGPTRATPAITMVQPISEPASSPDSEFGRAVKEAETFQRNQDTGE